MELLLLVDTINARGILRKRQSDSMWPPPRFSRLAKILNPLLLGLDWPQQLLLGAEQQRADHLVRMSCAVGGACSVQHASASVTLQAASWHIATCACIACAASTALRLPPLSSSH